MPRRYSIKQSPYGRATEASRRAARRKPDPNARKRPGVVPGYTRTGGFYKYSAAASRMLADADELKFFDTEILGTGIDTTAEALQSITLIPQGVTQSTRVGRRCLVRSVTMKGYIQWADGMSPTTYNTSIIKMALVWDKQANGANPAWTDIWTQVTGPANNVTTPRNLSNGERFQVLKEWILKPSDPITTTTDNWVLAANTAISVPLTKLKFNKKVNIPLEFSSTTGAIAELKTNNLVLMAFSQVGDDVHKLTAVFRVRFTG